MNLDYTLAIVAFLATCVATLGKAREGTAGRSYLGVSLYGWGAVVLGAGTLILQVYKAAQEAAERQDKATVAYESLHDAATSFGQVGASIEWINLPMQRLVPEHIMSGQFWGTQQQFRATQAAANRYSSIWATMPRALVRETEELLKLVDEISRQADEYNNLSRETLVAYADRLQTRAASVNAGVCRETRRQGKPVTRALGEPCKEDGRDWLSAADLVRGGDEAAESLRRRSNAQNR